MSIYIYIYIYICEHIHKCTVVAVEVST
jgi:hypothetical protein